MSNVARRNPSGPIGRGIDAARRSRPRPAPSSPPLLQLQPYEPGVATHPADRTLGRVVVVILLGYLVLGRSFAQIGVGAVNLFLGEVLLVLAVLDGRTRAGLHGALRSLVLPGPLHLLAWAAAVFVGYGAAQTGRALVSGADPIEALKVFAFHYYVAYLFIGVAIGLLVPDVLERVVRLVPWGVAGFLAVSAAGINVSLPFSSAIGLYAGAGAPIAMLALICFRPKLSHGLPAFAVCLLSWLYFQIRGDWLGVIAAIVVWALLTGRYRQLAGGVAAVGVLFSVIAALELRIEASRYRGGSLSAGEIFGRMVAPFSEDLGRRYARDAEVFAGTADWRRNFWEAIWAAVHSSDRTALFGLGYGHPLSELTTFITEDLRSPHNVFFFALGYGGWTGVVAFGLLHATVLGALVAVHRRTGNPFGIMLWTFATVTGLFGNYYETPYNSLPYYLLIGLSLAPLARRDRGVFAPSGGRRPPRRRATPHPVRDPRPVPAQVAGDAVSAPGRSRLNTNGTR
ncbi:MAG: O-antigen ligase family protein [Acidimicrobiia bacterium]